MSKRVAAITRQCVACGCCLPECPRKALSIYRGKYAVVNRDACVGCGKCATVCPSCVITIIQREGVSNEKAVV